MMAFTPGIASALLVSSRFTRACGIGLVSSLQKSMPSTRQSSAERALPVTFATRSGVVYFPPISLFAMTSASHQLSAAHQRGENLVVVLAEAQIALAAMRQ